MKITHNLIWLSLLAIITACQNTETIKAPADYEQLRKKEPLSESFNVKYLFTENGLSRCQVIAPHVLEQVDPSVSTEPVLYFDKGILVHFFNAEGKTESVLRANRAQLQRNSGIAKAEGNVILTNTKNEKLETEKLFWRRLDSKITTQSFVKITTEKDIILGDSLETNTSFTKYKIFKIKGVFKVKEE